MFGAQISKEKVEHYHYEIEPTLLWSHNSLPLDSLIEDFHLQLNSTKDFSWIYSLMSSKVRYQIKSSSTREQICDHELLERSTHLLRCSLHIDFFSLSVRRMSLLGAFVFDSPFQSVNGSISFLSRLFRFFTPLASSLWGSAFGMNWRTILGAKASDDSSHSRYFFLTLRYVCFLS